MRSRSFLGLVSTVVMVFSASYLRATVVGDLCSGDPCTVTATKTVTPGSVLDFGGRTLELSVNGKLNVSPAGSLTIMAGQLHLGNGRTIVDRGGSVTISTTGNIQLDSGSAIDTSTTDAGLATITLHADGDLVLNGSLNASGTSGGGGGGQITADGTNVTVGATVGAAGGSQSSGGGISLLARALLTVNATLDVSGGDLDGGTIELDADSDVVVAAIGKLDVHATGGSGFGGTVAVTATGTIDMHGPILGQGASADGFGGDGAEVGLVAGDRVLVAAPITAFGAVPDGYGGDIDIEAGTDIVQTALIDAKGNGVDGAGSVTFSMFAGRDVTTGPIDVSGGSSGGGSVDIEAVGSVTIPGEINADASGTESQAGDVTIAAEVVTVTATADVHASASFVSGNIYVQGCTVTAVAGSSIACAGDQGSNLIQAGGQMTLNGSILAGPSHGTNRVEYRDPTKPPLLGGSITPAATVSINPILAPCGAIVTTTTSTSTTSTTSSSTTTTTSLPGVTTTTLPAVTTTTLPGVTTTTLPAVTTTTSTLAPRTTTSTVTTTTIVAAISPCTPRDCNDGDNCTLDVCVLAEGQCTHEPLPGIASVSCRLDAIETLLGGAPRPVRRLRPKILAAQRLLNSAKSAQSKAAARLLGRAGKQIAGFIQGIEKGQLRHKIDPSVGGPLLDLAHSADASLTPLRTGAR
jgi:hypothetical protein